MVQTRTVLALALSSLLATSNALTPRKRDTALDETIPPAFDGQYITNPAPGVGNQAVEWWWFQALAPEVNGIVPSVEVIFYEGFAFTRAPADPTYRFDVSGVFPNGTSFFISTPVAQKPSIVTAGEAVVGTWGGLGSFALSGHRQNLVITFSDINNGLTGTIAFQNGGTAAHGPCQETGVPPYFTPLASGQTLNANEAILYEQTGWAITMPRAATVVDITVDGSALYLDNAIGYHDHNWAPQAINQFAYTWLTGQGSCGPFDLTYLEVQALGSPRAKDILKGYVAYNGRVLQNQCSLFGEGRATDTISVELTGQTTDPVTNQQIPTGLILDYTLGNGTHYKFTLQNSVQNPSQIPYHRWRLSGSGGQVGGPQYSCLLIGDWLNPGLATYTEGQSIFTEQSLS
ncbi:hypothetical protein GQ53DRAFT_828449 [Thozetella sp. PMI_491]|nr:hypothetical protein GQ53DRAFT_828449 [Thozetella sp. PMI_491]